jgi:NAD(P)-dependent dehydrogenase (short-subunit alcohol dehydrogenase family)
VDVLVSNAGLSRVQPPEDVTAAQFDEMLAVNLRAPFLLAQRTVPAMRERGFGRIRDADAGPEYAACAR